MTEYMKMLAARSIRNGGNQWSPVSKWTRRVKWGEKCRNTMQIDGTGKFSGPKYLLCRYHRQDYCGKTSNYILIWLNSNDPSSLIT